MGRRPDALPARRPDPAPQDARQIWARARQHPAIKGKIRLNAVLDSGPCEPGGLDGDRFVLLFDPKSKFRQDQVMAQQNRAAIEEALRSVVGRPVTLRCDTLRQQPQAAGAEEQRPDDFVREAERRLRAIHVER